MSFCRSFCCGWLGGEAENLGADKPSNRWAWARRFASGERYSPGSYNSSSRGRSARQSDAGSVIPDVTITAARLSNVEGGGISGRRGSAELRLSSQDQSEGRASGEHSGSKAPSPALKVSPVRFVSLTDCLLGNSPKVFDLHPRRRRPASDRLCGYCHLCRCNSRHSLFYGIFGR